MNAAWASAGSGDDPPSSAGDRHGPALPRWTPPRNWGLGARLVVALLTPALLAAALAGIRIADLTGAAAESQRVVRFATVQARVAELTGRLQQERLDAVRFVAAGRTGHLDRLQSSTEHVDTMLQTVESDLDQLYAEYPRPALAAVRQETLDAWAQLPAVRELTAATAASPTAVVARYSDLVRHGERLRSELLSGISAEQGAQHARRIDMLVGPREEATLQLALLHAATTGPDTSTAAVEALLASDIRLSDGLDRFTTHLEPAERVAFAPFVAGRSNSERELVVQRVARAAPPLPATTPSEVEPVLSAFTGDLALADERARTDLTSAARAASDEATELVVLNVVLLVVALLIGASVLSLLVRGTTRSLRRLRDAAWDVAQRELPATVHGLRSGKLRRPRVEPIAITTEEEIGQVARAFDAVHAEAVRLAVEQSALHTDTNTTFVNLSRRLQSLVGRQLSLIESMEGDETDPEQLTRLFRLDHLATRMRRNCDSLLVLAGHREVNRNSGPVSLGDVLLAAVSAVEQYERISLTHTDDLTVAGGAAADVLHLLAELLENATSMSPPDSPVELEARRGNDGSVTVTVADAGVGMAPDDLRRVNAGLAAAGSAAVDAPARDSRRMGLFVVGRLAQYHRITVRLGTRQPSGTVAYVVLPAEIIGRPAGGGRVHRSDLVERVQVVEPVNGPVRSLGAVPPEGTATAGDGPRR
ncbi:nitrate- and nitrite sensing domain-containing protein [Pseudonocardia sp. NPDC049635]|uniref:sensor histidine kinase n=1 Tax=Pseudonocardia sp. NPDC049635 TaxID=3155506 RepID=UPI0033BFFA4F